MLPPADADLAIRNLRDQVRHLEATLLLLNERASVFEAAATARLAVIEEGNKLLVSAQAVAAERLRAMEDLERLRLNAHQQQASSEAFAAERLRNLQQTDSLLDTARQQLAQSRQHQAQFESIAAERLRIIQHDENRLETARQELAQSRQLQASFEAVATERLRVIEEGGQLLRTRAETILALEKKIQILQADLAESRQQHDDALGLATSRAAAEQKRLELACREAKRGMEELAARERAQTRELLELRNEGLLHSIIRRIQALFA
jgi:hypothetical protein